MAVEGWTGWHGSGKTFNAVDHCLTQLHRRNVPLVTNALVVGYVEVGRWLEETAAYAAAARSGFQPPPDVVPLPRVLHFETWDDLMALFEVAILLRLRLQLLIDEAGKFLSSRFYSKLDPRVLLVLQERRKIGAGLDLFWTAPHYEHVDKILRDVTQVVHVCKRFGGTEYSHDGGRPPRAFWVRSYRPTDLGKAKKRAISRRLVPFSRELAALYTTGIVQMSTPIAAATDARPTLRDDAPDGAQVTIHAVKGSKGARRAA